MDIYEKLKKRFPKTDFTSKQAKDCLSLYLSLLVVALLFIVFRAISSGNPLSADVRINFMHAAVCVIAMASAARAGKMTIVSVGLRAGALAAVMAIMFAVIAFLTENPYDLVLLGNALGLMISHPIIAISVLLYTKMRK